jgi:hypothetical protein
MDPDEIAHLAFIEAYRNLERYRAESNFFAWLCVIARHRPSGYTPGSSHPPRHGAAT